MSELRRCAMTPYSAQKDIQKQGHVFATFSCYISQKKDLDNLRNSFNLMKIVINLLTKRHAALVHGLSCTYPIARH